MQANSECNYNDNNYEALTLHLESVSCRVRGNLILVLQEAAALVMMTTQLRHASHAQLHRTVFHQSAR